jgi:hypothetical protein
MVINDFRKTLLRKHENAKTDYFLIDLIDERFDILQVDNDLSLITKSPELVNSKYLEKTNSKIKLIKRLSYSMADWENDCDRYIETVTKIFSPKKIIIIQGKWAEKYLDRSGELHEFDGSNGFHFKNIREFNDQLEHYYDYLCKQLPQSRCICFPTAVADEKHEWGLSPFHYIKEHYEQIYSDLCTYIFDKK